MISCMGLEKSDTTHTLMQSPCTKCTVSIRYLEPVVMATYRVLTQIAMMMMMMNMVDMDWIVSYQFHFLVDSLDMFRNETSTTPNQGHVVSRGSKYIVNEKFDMAILKRIIYTVCNYFTFKNHSLHLLSLNNLDSKTLVLFLEPWASTIVFVYVILQARIQTGCMRTWTIWWGKHLITKQRRITRGGYPLWRCLASLAQFFVHCGVKCLRLVLNIILKFTLSYHNSAFLKVCQILRKNYEENWLIKVYLWTRLLF